MTQSCLGVIFLLCLSLCAQAQESICFNQKNELALPTTNFILTSRGEILNSGQKFANLPLPHGFVIECVSAVGFKNDSVVVLSISAKDYDKKNAFIFRLTNKDPKVLWTQQFKKTVIPHAPFATDKYLIVPLLGEIASLKPETGNIRWTFSSPETDGIEFKRLSLQIHTLSAEGSRPNEKIELNILDGKLISPQK
jgi:hypothetical protein